MYNKAFADVLGIEKSDLSVLLGHYREGTGPLADVLRSSLTYNSPPTVELRLKMQTVCRVFLMFKELYLNLRGIGGFSSSL